MSLVFFPGETDIEKVVGITGDYATVGVDTWADAVGTIVSEPPSLEFLCIVISNFLRPQRNWLNSKSEYRVSA